MTIRNVYGIDTPKIPEGWIATGEFRPPREGESYVPLTGTYAGLATCNHTGTDRPILRRL
jgi:hypothetical protein